MTFSKTPSLKQLVYENLRNRIVSGDLAPGTRLLEGELSKEMDISRAPIREALNMLERDGLATITPRRGAIVSVFTKEDVNYIWETRALLEPTAGRQAVDKISSEDLDRVEALLLKVRENPADVSLYTESDLEVHDLLYCNVQNHYLQTVLQNLKMHSLCVRWISERQKDGKVEAILTGTEEHMEIIRALRNRDGDAVYRAVEKHLIDSRVRTVSAAE